jgi:hypothetical protein
MNPAIETLLDLHAQHSRDELRELDAYRELCARYEGDDGFNASRKRVADLHEALEVAMRGAEGHDGQVVAALVVAKGSLRRSARLEILRELVRRRYAAGWSQAQRDYFEAAVEKLAKWWDYFLSFTSYNPQAPAMSYVNLEHEILIRAGTGLTLAAPDAVEKNLLARTLHNKLENVNLHGFFYEDHKNPGENVVQRLEDAAAGSFVFIQVVQSAMFKRDPGQHPNYCELEYKAAATEPSRLLAVLAEPRDDLIKPHDVHEQFEDWYGTVTGLDAVELGSLWTQEAARSKLQEIRDRVGKHVEGARRRVLDGVPL